MKNIGFLKGSGALAVICTLTLSLLSGCDDRKTLEEGGQIAVTPIAQPNSACGNGVSYGGGYPPDYYNIGAIPYGGGYPAGSQHLAQTGFCGCPTGYQATCDLQYGLTCLPYAGFQNFEVAHWQIQGAAFSFSGFSGYAGYGNIYGGGYGTPGFPQPYGAPGAPPTCSSQIAQTCSVGTMQCGMGHCAPLSPGSTVGVCVR